MDPEQFEAKVMEIIKKYGGRWDEATLMYDAEWHMEDGDSSHRDTDKLMEDLLISLGFSKGVTLIRLMSKYYN